MTATNDVVALKNRFPVFRNLGDPFIASVFVMADTLIDQRVWPSLTDFANARMFLAAHLLILEQQGMALASQGGGWGAYTGLFTSQIRFGERIVEFDERALFKVVSGTLGDGEMMYMMTYYGQLYLQLRARNIIPVAIV